MNVLKEIRRWRANRYQSLIAALVLGDVVLATINGVGLIVVGRLVVQLVDRRRRAYPEVAVVLARIVPRIVRRVGALYLAGLAALAEVARVRELAYDSVGHRDSVVLVEF